LSFQTGRQGQPSGRRKVPRLDATSLDRWRRIRLRLSGNVISRRGAALDSRASGSMMRLLGRADRAVARLHDRGDRLEASGGYERAAMKHAEDRSQASAPAWLKCAYQSTQRAASASGAHPRANDRAQSTAARRRSRLPFCRSNPNRTDLGTRRPREISYRVLTMSLDRAIARNASRIFIRCISPQSLHLIFFVVFQTLARLEASIATSHWLCPFVAGHLNVRNAVIVNIWGFGVAIASVCFATTPKYPA
jgi:hypothetical protein